MLNPFGTAVLPVIPELDPVGFRNDAGKPAKVSLNWSFGEAKVVSKLPPGNGIGDAQHD